MLHGDENPQVRLGVTPRAWSIIGYVRDIDIILGILFGAIYLYDQPEAFDAFLYWSIGHYYRH
jgi:hypothetical protein